MYKKEIIVPEEEIKKEETGKETKKKKLKGWNNMQIGMSFQRKPYPFEIGYYHYTSKFNQYIKQNGAARDLLSSSHLFIRGCAHKTYICLETGLSMGHPFFGIEVIFIGYENLGIFQNTEIANHVYFGSSWKLFIFRMQYHSGLKIQAVQTTRDRIGDLFHA